MARLTPHRIAYHEQQLADRKDDYYTRAAAYGEWYGGGADTLGLLAERVEPGDLGRLTQGQHPKTGIQLRRRIAPRTERVRIVDPDTGDARMIGRTYQPVGGFDMVFSAPKSISLAYALAPDPSVREAILAAHRTAVHEALAVLDQHACYTRRGAQGADAEAGRGVVAALFEHELSREVEHPDGSITIDPQLHTHCLVGNLTQASDDRWRTVDSRVFLRDYPKALGAVYQAVLRHEITTRLGWRWRRPENGLAELRGWPSEALRVFSQRRIQIEKRLARDGVHGPRAAQIAAHATRRPKNQRTDPATELDDWRSRLVEHGMPAEALVAATKAKRGLDVAPPTGAQLDLIANHLAGPAGLTHTTNRFRRADAITAYANALGLAPDHQTIVAHADTFLSSGAIEALDDGTYTARSLLRDEAEILRLADRAREACVPPIPRRAVDDALDDAPVVLSDAQRGAAHALTASRHAVELLQARAGTGKTLLLGRVAAAHEAAGYHVIGACPTGAAARALTDAGIPATTIDALRTRWYEYGLPADRPLLLIIDEAGMVGTRHLAALLHAADATGAKAILAGDRGQLPGVPAGGAFRHLCRAHPPVRIDEVHRQSDADEARLLQRLRLDDTGASEEYLTHKIRRGQLRLTSRADRAIERAEAWWHEAAARHGAERILLVTRDNQLRDLLNERIRREYNARGALRGPELEATGRRFRAGDRVICRRNDHRLRTHNGARGTIAAIEPAKRRIDVRIDDGATVRLPARYLDAGHLEHAYALTGHTSQGATVDAALIVAEPDDLTAPWAYTALTRSRQPAELLVVAPTAPMSDDQAERRALAMHAIERRTLVDEHQPLATHARRTSS